jgi:hypothetical protein
VNFEQGERYLLFLSKTNKGHSIKFLEETLAICKLSGEYPSIIMLPGPAEYDATYFGAETKYVTADEFIQLFIDAVNAYSSPTQPNRQPTVELIPS